MLASVMDRLRDESHQSLGLYLRANFVTQSASMALFFKRAATARLSSLDGVGWGEIRGDWCRPIVSRPSMRTFKARRVEPVAMLSERTEKTNRNADREDQQRHCRVGGHETIPIVLAIHAKVGF